MRRGLLVLLVLGVVVGCAAPAPIQVPSPVPAPEEKAPAHAEAPPSEAVQATPAVRRTGQELEVTGIGRATDVTWSPSGRRAVIQAGRGAYLLEVDSLTVRPLAGLSGAVSFWSEDEVLWQGEGSLQLRDLVSDQDRLLHQFGAPVIHRLRPEDTHYVALRSADPFLQGYGLGQVVAGRLGTQEERILLPSGYLVGRLRTGQLLAVAGENESGPLWAISPEGELHPLSEGAAHFVQISPGGDRALWLTDREERPVNRDQFYDPPLTDLWVWDGHGAPHRTPLGGSLSVQAAFSPDGSRIALALNEGFVTSDDARPGKLAAWEKGEIRPLAPFEGKVGLGIWLEDGFTFTPPGWETTGALMPLYRVDLSGQQGLVKGFRQSVSRWDQTGVGPATWRSLIMIWPEREPSVYWRDSQRVLQVEADPLDSPLYARPTDPYLPFALDDQLLLRPLGRRVSILVLAQASGREIAIDTAPPVAGAAIQVPELGVTLITDGNGIATGVLPLGRYSFAVTKEGFMDALHTDGQVTESDWPNVLWIARDKPLRLNLSEK